MSQERLDETCRLMTGTRDAVHVPIVAAVVDRSHKGELTPGDFVKFTDAEFTKFLPCKKNEAHGILNPFIDEISRYEPVVVMLVPGITSPVRHNFDIDPKQQQIKTEMLKAELEEAKQSDPECAECWIISNNRIIRL